MQRKLRDEPDLNDSLGKCETMLQKLRNFTEHEKIRQIALAGYALLARSMQQVSALVMTLLAARFLLPEEYGVYALGIVVLLSIQTLAYTGFYNFVIVSAEPEDEVLSTSFWLILGLSTAAAVIASLAAYPIEYLFDAPNLGLVIILLVAGQPLAGYTAWASAVLVRRQQVTRNFHLTFAQNIISMVLGVTALVIWQSIFALVIFRWLRVLTGFFLFYFFAIKFPGFSVKKTLIKQASRFASGLYATKALGLLSQYSSTVLVGLYFSTAEVGLFRFGSRMAFGATDAVVQPVSIFAVSQFGAEARNERKFQRVLVRFAGTMTLVSGMVGVGIIVFAEQGISLMFKEEYLAALIITYAVALRSCVGIGKWLLEPTFAALGKTGIIVSFNFFSMLGSLAAVFITAPMGIEVMAWTATGLTVLNTGAAFAIIRLKGGVPVAGSVRCYLIALGLVGAYGLTLWQMNVHLVPLFGWAPMWSLIAGIAIAAVIGIGLMYLASRLRVFTLQVFSG